MNVELICVGSELLSGDVVNTNASYISKKLRELGHDSFRQFTVDDNKYRLSELIEASLKRCDILIVTGGLGPTADDITKETVCEALGLELVENEHCRLHIENYFKKSGRTPTENNFKQATAPKGAVIFDNDKGTACGIGIEDGDKRVILLPGPPKELTYMFEQYVVPYLKGLSHHAIVSHTLNVFGMGESLIETLIKPFCEKENPVVATYCGNNECEVKITATADTEAKAESICSKTILQIKELLGDCVYGVDSDGLAAEVVNSLRSSGLKVSTAESCTGGMLSQALTSVSHSSEVVEIGILAYSNRIKHEALSVPEEVLSEKGAISPETAMYLAKNVRLLSDSDIGVGITGNAGPTASEDKPIGLVYIAIADKTKYFIKRLQLSSGYDRERIRSYATLSALDLVRRYVASRPGVLPGMVGYDSEFVFEEDVEAAPPAMEEAPAEEPAAVFDPNMNFIVFDAEENDSETLPIFTEEPEDEDVLPPATDETEEAELSEPEENEEKRPAAPMFFIKRLIHRIFPNKSDNVRDIIIKIVAIVAAVALIVSSAVLVNHYVDENKQRGIIQQARDNFEFDDDEKNEETNQYVAFEPFVEQNQDIRGWISISNTNVDNPVYQTTDNEYYLKHNMLKESSRYGALFFDYRNNIEYENNSQNLTIYGHNMRDGSMFASLNTSYRKLSFYKQNPTIQLKTLYEKSDYAIFAVFITNASAKDDNGYIYDYTKSDFATDEEFLAWIAEAKERSLITTEIEIEQDDEILTLSTCCYDFNDARFVVMAKKLDADEPLPNFSSAQYNSNPRYPQAYYDKHGEKGYVPTETSSEAVSADPPSSSAGTTSSEDTTSGVNDSSTEPSSSSTSVPADTNTCVHSGPQTYENITASAHSFICAECGESIKDAPHVYNQKNTDAKYLKDKATCTAPATYFYSCVCGQKGTTTFTSGSAAEHSFGEWTSDESQHWKICGVGGEKAEVGDHVFGDDDTCDTCGHQKSNDTSGDEQTPAA